MLMHSPARSALPLLRCCLSALTLCLASALALAQQSPQMNLVRTKLSAGMHLLDVQVAQTNIERQTGLMFRKDMPQHEGIFLSDEGLKREQRVQAGLCVYS